MILPITAYGHPVLKKKAVEITRDYPELDKLIADMHETMYYAHGVGLAAPQVNLGIRLFIIDGTPYGEDMPEAANFKEVFINPLIVEEEGEEWVYNEGCLSVPNIREDISRKPRIRVQYYDLAWNFHDKWFDGVPARIIQHEYDHIEGSIFIERASPLRKVMLRKRLQDISEGRIDVDYKMIFPFKPKRRR
jgi:peptide deformylase